MRFKLECISAASHGGVGMGKIKLLTICLLAVIAAGCAGNGGVQNDGVHKVVIQVSSDDPRTQTIALNNAVNLQKALGPGNIKVEVVAYGPGLTLLTRNGRQSKRVQDLVMYDEFRFSACGNTMEPSNASRASCRYWLMAYR